MRFSIFFAVIIMAVGSSQAPAEVGRQVAPGVREVRLEIPDHLTKILPSRAGAPLVPGNPGSITVKPAKAAPGDQWVNLLAEDFEAEFPGSTWTLFYEPGGPHWDVWECLPGSSPPHSAGCAAGGEEAIKCDEEYPNFLNSFMTAGPFSLASTENTAGVLECIMNLDSELENDVFFMLVSLTGVDEWNGFQYTGGYTNKHLSLDLANVPFLGNILDEPEVWVSFGFRSNESNVEVNGAQIDDVILAVSGSEVSEDVPSLQISVLKNPGRTRTVQILVRIDKGSGFAPRVTVGSTNVPMTSLGENVYSGSYSATKSLNSITISASDTTIEGTGTTQATVSFQ